MSIKSLPVHAVKSKVVLPRWLQTPFLSAIL